ncbi:hypothetical protein X801_08391, partial [Opisthorchis viverrini]
DHCSSGFKASVNGEETAVSEHSNSLIEGLGQQSEHTGIRAVYILFVTLKQWFGATDILSQKLQRFTDCARYDTHQDVMKFTTSQVDGRLEINKFIEANQSFHPKNYLDTVSCQTDVLYNKELP